MLCGGRSFDRSEVPGQRRFLICCRRSFSGVSEPDSWDHAVPAPSVGPARLGPWWIGAARYSYPTSKRRPVVSSHSPLALFLVGVVALLVMGGLLYVAHQHPSLATPLMVAIAGGALVVACLGLAL